jgi:hypothetical protein
MLQAFVNVQGKILEFQSDGDILKPTDSMDIRRSTSLDLQDSLVNSTRAVSPIPTVQTSVWGIHPSPTKVGRRLKSNLQKITRLQNRGKILRRQNENLKTKLKEVQSGDEISLMKRLKWTPATVAGRRQFYLNKSKLWQ